MSSTSKKVTYKNPNEENADYLVPLQYDEHAKKPRRKKSTRKKTVQTGYFGSIYFLITVLLYAGVPISQFVIGIIYVGQCTIQQFIPIYMILSGIFGIAFAIIGSIMWMQIRKQISLYDEPRANGILRILSPIFIVLFLCVFSWFIAGQVIIFQVKVGVEFFDPDLPEYCHGHLYKAAYVLLFVDYIIGVLAIILGIVYRITSSDDSHVDDNDEDDGTNSKRSKRRTEK